MNTFTASVIATGSVINTFTQSVNTSTSSLNTYTASLLGAVSVTGSNLRVLGNVNVQNDLIVSGNIVAQNYIVSSSVTYMTTSFSSGSTTFGNDAIDNHNFTGSVYVVGSISSSATITAATHSGHIKADNGVVSSSGQFVNYGALLTSSANGVQAVSGTLIISGNSSLTGSTTIDLRGVPSGNFTVQNGATRIDSILFVSDNDYVSNAYVGGDIRVGDYLAGGYTAHYDGGVQITGSLRVNAGQNGSGSYFTGSVWITGNEAVSGNLQVVQNTSVSGNFIGTTISASSAVTASSLRVEGLTRINGEVDIDTTQITIGAGGNAVADETRLNTLNLRVDSDTFFNSNVTAISGSTRVKSLAINDLSMSRIPYVDSTDTLVDSANFTYNGVTFKVGGGVFEIDDSTGNIRTSGSLKVDGATTLHSTLNVTGSVGITGSLIVTGSTIISSSLRVNNTASFAHLNVTGSTNVTGSLSVGGALAVSGSSRVSGNFAVSGTLDISGRATFDSYVNITGGLAITGGFSVKGEPVLIGDSMSDSIIISGGLEITGSLTRNTTNLKATGSNNPADAIYRLTEAQAWSSSFTTNNTSSGAWIRTPDEYLEYFVGQGSNKRRYVTPVWLDETLYADDYFDISVVSGADSDYVF
jgi:cytoskeletal protein CcmA (bactofilin family)